MADTPRRADQTQGDDRDIRNPRRDEDIDEIGATPREADADTKEDAEEFEDDQHMEDEEQEEEDVE